MTLWGHLPQACFLTLAFSSLLLCGVRIGMQHAGVPEVKVQKPGPRPKDLTSIHMRDLRILSHASRAATQQPHANAKYVEFQLRGKLTSSRCFHVHY